MHRLAAPPLRRAAAASAATKKSVPTRPSSRPASAASASASPSPSSLRCRLLQQPPSPPHQLRCRRLLPPSRSVSASSAARTGDPPEAGGGGSRPGGGGSANAARDTRLAGRRRFYKVVGIAPSSPPWEHFGGGDDGTDGVDNPISAGVDGTQSASGVSTKMETTTGSADSVRRMLTPNPPDGGDDESGADAAQQWYGITLDSRTVRTPLGTPLAVPSSTLALAIASEWDDQSESIKPAQMPLTTLACTALDQIASHPSGAATVRDNVLRYLRNDTACYLTDPGEDRVLYRRQLDAWGELHDWATEHLGASPAKAVGNDEGLVMSRARKAKPQAGLPHPEVLVREAEGWVDSLDAWRLAALQAVTMEAKSFLVGMAVVMGAEQGSAKEEEVGGGTGTSQPPYAESTKDAVEASRVEEEFQIANWGLVEGGHDYDRLNCSVSVHSATVMVASIASAV